MEAAQQLREAAGMSVSDRTTALEHKEADRLTPNLPEQQRVTPRSECASQHGAAGALGTQRRAAAGISPSHGSHPAGSLDGRFGPSSRRGSSPFADGVSATGSVPAADGSKGTGTSRPRGDTVGTGTGTSGTMTSPRSDGGRSRSSALDRVRKQSIDMQRDAGEQMTAIRTTTQVRQAAR